jgi:hypothetical protein
MGLNEDFRLFVDGGSPVPYYVDGAVYVIKPTVIQEVFEYQLKIFYRSFNEYSVGVPFSQFVRPISASDFKLMKQLKEDSQYKNNTNKVVHLKQLVFDF